LMAKLATVGLVFLDPPYVYSRFRHRTTGM